jgi:hypothetical protein
MKCNSHLGIFLSITTGLLVSRDHIGGVYKILNYMTNDNLFTHQLPRASDECKPALLAQHPQLAAVEVPELLVGEMEVYTWLSQQEAIYGATLDIEPLAAEDHTSIDPIAELKMIRPDMPIIVIDPTVD